LKKRAFLYYLELHEHKYNENQSGREINCDQTCLGCWKWELLSPFFGEPVKKIQSQPSLLKPPDPDFIIGFFPPKSSTRPGKHRAFSKYESPAKQASDSRPGAGEKEDFGVLAGGKATGQHPKPRL
jgi:hypothetical protein